MELTPASTGFLDIPVPMPLPKQRCSELKPKATTPSSIILPLHIPPAEEPPETIVSVCERTPFINLLKSYFTEENKKTNSGLISANFSPISFPAEKESSFLLHTDLISSIILPPKAISNSLYPFPFIKFYFNQMSEYNVY